MAGSNRKNWEELNLTKEDVENLTQAFKKEEFRKLLVEYAEEVSDPKNRKQYQEDIIQLEAERGVDCTFVDPEPGFVIKTSVDGKKKAFINVCQNKVIGRPSSKPQLQNDNWGLSWSIPYSQAPGREDHDKKRNRCVVYDVVFHPETLHLAEKNSQFRKLVVDTALNAVEDSYNVKLDHKNIRFPKLKFKGMPFATVIRKKSKNPVVLTEEELEFQKTIKYPFSPPAEADSQPNVKNFDNKKADKEKYTVPNYVIKHRSDIDLQEFTYDKNAKINVAIPKQLVIEVNLPLLNSTNQVTLDVMEKSIHLICEKPVKYKLDLQLPYSVDEEAGNAKFDTNKRMLIITLPVRKAQMSFTDLVKEDSGVESDIGDRANSYDDSSPVGSIQNNDMNDSDGNGKNEDEEYDDKFGKTENLIELIPAKDDHEEKDSIHNVGSEEHHDAILVGEEQIVNDDAYRTSDESCKFLDYDKHYSFPSYTCNIEKNNVCFIVKVKNVDALSVVQKTLGDSAFHVKFTSIGSGFFPMHYAFLVKFEEGCHFKDTLNIDTWNNNLTIQLELELQGTTISKYYVGLDEESLKEKYFDEPIQFEKILNEMKYEPKQHLETTVNVLSANIEEVVVSVAPVKIPKNKKEKSITAQSSKDSDDSEVSQTDDLGKINGAYARSISESSGDEVVLSASPATRKSILKKRICRSLSESNADDYQWPSSVEGTFLGGSDSCIPEEPEAAIENIVKKTVRFNENILRQTFRANSSILGQRKKNQRRALGKRKAMERRASESENSEPEDKEKGKKNNKGRKGKTAFVEELPKEEKTEPCDTSKAVINNEKDEDVPTDDKITQLKENRNPKKNEKFVDFNSDLIFDIDI